MSTRIPDTSMPVIGFAAFSGAGKTTLMAAVIAELKADGVRLGVIKHAHHNFEPDTPGKDSYVLRHSGADQILVASRHRRAWIVEHPDVNDKHSEPTLAPLVATMREQPLDVILVEGFKDAPIAKIEIHRPATGHALLAEVDDHVIAVATDEPTLRLPAGVDKLDLNGPRQVAHYIQAWMRTRRRDANAPTLKAVDAD